MKKFLTLSMLTALVLVGCNKATAPVVTTTTQPATTPAVEPAKAAPAVIADEVIAKAPAGCPAKTALVVKSKEAGTVEIMNRNSWYIEGNKNSPGFASLYFVNYEGFDTNDQYGHTNKGTDATTYISLMTKDKSAVKKGIWKSGENNNLSSISVTTEASGRDLTNDKSQVELTYVGTDYVCGKIAADNNGGSVNGEFIAKYSKQK